MPIPARCPVTGGRTCHRAACRYYRFEADGLCAHPEARTAGTPAAFETGPLSAAAVSRTWTARVIAAWRIVAGAATAWTGRARRPRRRRGAGEHILMHRLLHHDCAGGWTWRVRGAQVPAARTTDVCLVIDPAADSHYCPDCLLGAVPLWDATAGNHMIVKMPDSSPAVAGLVKAAVVDLQARFGAAIERGRAAGEIAAGSAGEIAASVDPIEAGRALVGLYLGLGVHVLSGEPASGVVMQQVQAVLPAPGRR